MQRARQVVNLVNLSTPLGLLVALISRCRITRGPAGLLVASGYRIPFPPASAFTLGNVVLVRIGEAELARRPRLLVHEGRHATQFAVCLGPLMLPLYGLAAVWSWLRTGDHYSRNVFERLAGLADGYYAERPVRRFFSSRTG